MRTHLKNAHRGAERDTGGEPGSSPKSPPKFIPRGSRLNRSWVGSGLAASAVGPGSDAAGRGSERSGVTELAMLSVRSTGVAWGRGRRERVGVGRESVGRFTTVVRQHHA